MVLKHDPQHQASLSTPPEEQRGKGFFVLLMAQRRIYLVRLYKFMETSLGLHILESLLMLVCLNILCFSTQTPLINNSNTLIGSQSWKSVELSI